MVLTEEPSYACRVEFKLKAQVRISCSCFPFNIFQSKDISELSITRFRTNECRTYLKPACKLFPIALPIIGAYSARVVLTNNIFSLVSAVDAFKRDPICCAVISVVKIVRDSISRYNIE